MKKLFALFLILLCAITVFCACDGSFGYTKIAGDGVNTPTISPYKSQTLTNKDVQKYKVYVGGAVQNEGYYVVAEGKTVADVVALAGILPQTIFPENANTYIKNDCQILLNYNQDGVNYLAINVNGIFIQSELFVKNVPDSVIAKLKAYYTQNGAITNKQILKQILTTEEYQQNYYKFFISEVDYATPGQ